MSRARIVSTTLVAFLVWQVMAGLVHGFILAGDYQPYEGTLLRGGQDGPPPWQMLFLPVAHLVSISALVWVYARLRLDGSPATRGLALGVVSWMIAQVPLWLVWYAEQPWPGPLVVKQLGLELLASMILGLVIAYMARSPLPAARPEAARV
jgi:hypothetical protein